jgi:hypothetical protein
MKSEFCTLVLCVSRYTPIVCVNIINGLVCILTYTVFSVRYKLNLYVSYGTDILQIFKYYRMIMHNVKNSKGFRDVLIVYNPVVSIPTMCFKLQCCS